MDDLEILPFVIPCTNVFHSVELANPFLEIFNKPIDALQPSIYFEGHSIVSDNMADQAFVSFVDKFVLVFTGRGE